MTTLQCRSHQAGIPDALEGVIHATAGQFDDDVLYRSVVVIGVDRIGSAELPGQFEFVGIDVDSDNSARFRNPRALDDAQANAAEPEYGNGRSRLHLGGIQYRTDAGSDSAAEQTDFLERRLLADLGDGDLRQHRVLAERRGAHVVIDGLAVVREPRCAVGHQALALGRTNRLAQVGLARGAEAALAAFGRVQGNNVIADGDGGDARTHLLDDCAAFVPEDRRKDTFRVFS